MAHPPAPVRRARRPQRLRTLLTILLATAFVVSVSPPTPASASGARVPAGYHHVDTDAFTGEHANVKLLGDVVFSRRDGSRNVYVTNVVGGVIHRRTGTPKCVYIRLWYLYERYESSAGGYVEGGWNITPSASVGVTGSVTTGLHRQSGGVIWLCPTQDRRYPRLWFNHQQQHHPMVNGVLVAMAVEWGHWDGRQLVRWYDVNSLGGR